jgi:nitroreductase
MNPVPAVEAWREKACIACGQCAAVCPAAAVRLTFMPSLPPADYEPPLDFAGALRLVRNRRSVRAYQKRKVDMATLRQLLELGRYAPSAHNSQQVEWRLYSDGQTLAALTIDWLRWLKEENSSIFAALDGEGIIAAWERGQDVILRGAPHILLASCNTQEMGRIDALIALSYVDLLAPLLGLGTCWAGFLIAALNYYPPLQTFLALEKGRAAYGALMLGYPELEFHSWPERREARLVVVD